MQIPTTRVATRSGLAQLGSDLLGCGRGRADWELQWIDMLWVREDGVAANLQSIEVSVGRRGALRSEDGEPDVSPL